MDYDLTFYLAGPMSGIPGSNFPAFEAACKFLRKNKSLNIVSPHEIVHEDKSYSAIIKKDLDSLGLCQGVILLPGWAGSRGVVQHELPLAQSLRLPVYLLIGSDIYHMGGPE